MLSTVKIKRSENDRKPIKKVNKLIKKVGGHPPSFVKFVGLVSGGGGG